VNSAIIQLSALGTGKFFNNSNNFNLMESLFTRKEVAAILKVSSETIRNMEKKGLLIPAIRINGRPRYTRQSLLSITKEVPNGNDLNQ
jgi:hypothetical protein